MFEVDLTSGAVLREQKVLSRGTGALRDCIFIGRIGGGTSWCPRVAVSRMIYQGGEVEGTVWAV